MPCLVKLSLIYFLKGTTNHFISDVVSIFLHGEDQLKTNQPYDQAGR